MNIYEKYMGIFSKGNYYPIKEVDNNQRGISFIGSIALLVSAMTGPGLVTSMVDQFFFLCSSLFEIELLLLLKRKSIHIRECYLKSTYDASLHK